MLRKINKKDLKNKINDLLFSNRFIRAFRTFIHQKLKPLLLKIIAGLLASLIIVIIALKIINPTYLDELYKRSSFHFQRFLNLDNQEYYQINVKGNNRSSKDKIIDIAHRVQNSFKVDIAEDKYQPLIQKMTYEIKDRLPWVNKVNITREIPNVIHIEVEEYQPFALWYHDDKKYVVDKSGNTILVEDVDGFRDLIIVSGKDANLHIVSLFNIFTINPKLGSEVYSATWSGGRRWDIRLDNGLLIKLPESNISDAWDSLIKIYNMPGSILGLNIIDLRISGKVYLEYQDSVIKEIKNL